jgi:hypothetical protein
MRFHGDEDFIGINDLMFNEKTERYADDIKKLLSKYYEYDTESEEFNEDTHIVDTPYQHYEIRAEYEDECCDDSFKSIIHININLPNDEDAKELADIIDGKVVDGLHRNDPTFRITYRNEIYIKAKTKEEAEQIFSEMSGTEINSNPEFVEIVSTEKQN